MEIKQINKLAEEALALNRTFAEGTHAKQALPPTGFLPPNKRIRIVEILEEIAKLTTQ
jgi:hypothetical protein